jgi:hypothetical protein
VAIDKSWESIFDEYKIWEHDFNTSPYYITAAQIKKACQDFRNTGEKEVRILCKQDRRESRPAVFQERNLFLLPVVNKKYVIVKGEGYIDIPSVTCDKKQYSSKLNFNLDTSLVGNSEMQHLDFAYASSLIRSFIDDDSLVLTIRGRKYTPEFSFHVGKHELVAKSVQTEVDAGYEGREQVVLVEAKNSISTNTIIRQLYYPFRQWQSFTTKPVRTVFFEKQGQDYRMWEFCFREVEDYNSIKLVKSGCYRIVSK